MDDRAIVLVRALSGHEGLQGLQPFQRAVVQLSPSKFQALDGRVVEPGDEGHEGREVIQTLEVLENETQRTFSTLSVSTERTEKKIKKKGRKKKRQETHRCNVNELFESLDTGTDLRLHQNGVHDPEDGPVEPFGDAEDVGRDFC